MKFGQEMYRNILSYGIRNNSRKLLTKILVVIQNSGTQPVNLVETVPATTL